MAVFLENLGSIIILQRYHLIVNSVRVYTYIDTYKKILLSILYSILLDFGFDN